MVDHLPFAWQDPVDSLASDESGHQGEAVDSMCPAMGCE